MPNDENKVDRAELDKVIAERDEAKKNARALQTQFETMQTEFKKMQEAVAAKGSEEEAIKKAAEKKRLEEEGKYKEILQKQEADFKTALDAANKRLEEQRAGFNNAILPTVIRAAIADVPNLVEGAADDLTNNLAIRSAIRLDEQFRPIVVNEKGEVVKDDKLNPVSPAEFIKKQVKPFHLRDQMPTGKGTPPGENKGTGEFTMANALRDPAIRSSWKEKDPDGFEKARQEYYSPEAVAARDAERFKK